MHSPEDTNADPLDEMNGEQILTLEQIREQFATQHVDFPNWVLGAITWKGDERILDLGCGTGAYYPRLRDHLPQVQYHGLDIIGEVFAEHPASDSLIQADAQQLPYADNSFDVVMANHLVYYVPDIERLVSEVRRVLRPQGVLLAATHSVHNMAEFQELFRRAVLLLTVPGTGAARSFSVLSDAFSLESGTRLLSRHFEAVIRHDLPTNLVFNDADSAIAYINSMRELSESRLPMGVNWNEVILIVRQQVASLLEHFGELSIGELSGVLAASNRDEFAYKGLDHSSGE